MMLPFLDERVVLAAEGDDPESRPYAKRTRIVIDPGMDDAAIMAGLLGGRARVLFDDGDDRVRMALDHMHRSRKADQSRAKNARPRRVGKIAELGCF